MKGQTKRDHLKGSRIQTTTWKDPDHSGLDVKDDILLNTL